MQGSIISDNKDLLTGNYLTSEESSLNILDPPSLYVENNYVELLNTYPEDVSVHYALNKTPTRDDSVLDKSISLPSSGNYYFKAFGEDKESTNNIIKFQANALSFKEFPNFENSPFKERYWVGDYGNNIYVAANEFDTTPYYSYNGLNWLPCNFNEQTAAINSITFCKNVFFVVYSIVLNGEEFVSYSLDGINFNKLDLAGIMQVLQQTGISLLL